MSKKIHIKEVEKYCNENGYYIGEYWMPNTDKKIHLLGGGVGKIDKDGKITDYTLLSYDLVTPPKRTLFRRIFNFFKKLWNFIKPKQR
jgi:hypothetical protein